jgi:predicted amidohydrolase
VGLSQVAVPFVGPIAAVKNSSEGMIIADIDLKVLELAEVNYKVREDISRVDWHYK